MPETAQSPDAPPPLGTDDYTRWTDRNARPTRIGAQPSPAFSLPPVYRCVQGPDTRRLDLVGVDRTQTFHYTGRKSADASGRTLLYRSDQGEIIEVRTKDTSAVPPYPTVQLPDHSMIAPAMPLDKPGPGSSTWSQTFNLNERVNWDEWLFKGHDLFQVNPRDLQDSNALRDHVFLYPAGDSLDYHVDGEGAAKAVPNGATYVPDDVTTQRKKQHAASSESEFQRSWTWGVGVSAETKESFGLASAQAAFKANADFKGSIAETVAKSSGSTVSVGAYYRYALVLDLPHVQLDTLFAQRVEELCGQLDDPELDTYLGQFVDAFGTHYAKAVTCGAMAIEEYYFSKSRMTSMQSSGMALSAEVSVGESAGVGDFKEEASGSASTHGSSDTSHKYTRDDENGRTDFYAVGGEASANGGFTVGQSPVPILADLRPIQDLFNVVLLPDLDTEDLARCRQKLADHVAARATKLGGFSDKSLLPLPMFEIEVVGISGLDLSGADEVSVRIEPPAPDSHGKPKLKLVQGDDEKWTWPRPAPAPDDPKQRAPIGESIPVNLKTRYVGQAARADDIINVRATIRGKWRDPEDKDVHDSVVVALRLSGFPAQVAAAPGKVSRDRGSLKLDIQIRNSGAALGP